jgi:acetyltransferase-like isoleucine patch superfamily enzyme
MGILLAAFRATAEPLVREPLFKVIRRADDRDDSWTRALLERDFSISVGRQTYGAYAIDGRVAPGTRIGAFCSLAPGARLGGSQHPTTLVSTHPFPYLSNRGFVTEDVHGVREALNDPVVVEDDVWLGANSLVLPGVTVARGAVVGAGAVVTKDVGPYEVAVGVPARVVRTRLPGDKAAALAAVPWPEWDDQTIRERIDEFRDVDAFLDRYGNQS